MPQYNVQDIRNIALCGHGSSGKTTITDRSLNLTGAVTRPASVDDGTSVCDFDEEEKHHKYSVEAALVHFDHAGKHFNLIDTPGYPDFIGQAIGSLRAVETALIVVNAHSGIEVNTRRMFQEAGKAGVGRMIVTSKMDSENIIPAETNSPEILSQVMPELAGKVSAMALNVPVADGSTIDLTAIVRQATSKEAVNAAVAAACSGRFRNLIEFTADPIVSSDVRTSTFSGVFDSLSTMVMEETMVKTITWFNNGWGYSARIIEVLEQMAETLTSNSPGVGGKE